MFRPSSLSQIIGQKAVVNQLKIAIFSAKKRNDSLPHILLLSPPGCGKNSLCEAIKHERDVDMQYVNAASVKNIVHLLHYFRKVSANSILFIDEIHRLNISVEEWLYTVLEDFKYTFECEQYELPRFTVIGATTKAGSLSNPLYDRFVLKFSLSNYSVIELANIIKQSAFKSKINITDKACISLAKASRGVPRVANNNLSWVRDFCVGCGHSKIECKHVVSSLKMSGIDENGLDNDDKKYLSVLRRTNKPIGLKNLSLLTNIAEETIETKIEPFLLRLGLVQKTSKGRILV